MKRMLVTGGAGFIGSHFVEQFVEDGNDVLVVDNLSSGRKENLPTHCRFRHMDIGAPEFEKVIKDFRPELIFHFAAQIDVRISAKEPTLDARQNIINTLRLLELGLEHGLEFFGFASSGGAIYGEPITIPQGEDHPADPLSPYGVAKLSIDKYLHSFHHYYGLKSCSMRFSNVYGPRQSSRGEAGVVSIFAHDALNRQPIQINGDGLQTRDFVYVKDLAKAGSLIVTKRPTGIYNLGTGVETSIVTLANLIQDHIHFPLRIQHCPGKDGEQRRSVLDYSKAKEDLGWAPMTTLAEGLANTIDWLANSGLNNAVVSTPKPPKTI